MLLRKRILSAAVLSLAALARAACADTKNNFTVNPDGSVKVTINALVQAPPDFHTFANPGDPAAPAPKRDTRMSAKDTAASFICNAKGVDAWADVTTEIAKDGRVHITATAYASNINKLRFGDVPPVKWTVDAAGNGTLELITDRPSSRPATQPEKTDEQIKAEVEKAKAEYKERRGVIGPILITTAKIDLTYTVPGTISTAVIFTKAGPNSANFVIEGRQLLEAMDKMMADDAALAASAKAGKRMDNNIEATFLHIYGSKGPAVVTFAGATKPVFDFQAESAAAKEKQAAMLKDAGIDLTPWRPKTPGGSFLPPG